MIYFAMSHFNCSWELKLLRHPPSSPARPPAAEKQLCRHINIMSVVFVDAFFLFSICMQGFSTEVACCIIIVSRVPSFSVSLSVGTNQNFQENHSFSFSSHYTHGVTSAIYHPGHRQVGALSFCPQCLQNWRRNNKRCNKKQTNKPQKMQIRLAWPLELCLSEFQ